MKIYGDQLDIPTSHAHSEKSETTEAPADFWDDAAHQTHEVQSDMFFSAQSSLSQINKNNSKEGPKVNLAHDASTKAGEYKPSLIGKKVVASKKGVSLFRKILLLNQTKF